MLATLVMSWIVYTEQSRWVWASVSASRKYVGPYCLAGLPGPQCLWCWEREAVWCGGSGVRGGLGRLAQP